jgi:alpha-soluble NSF attachment protein
MQPTPGGMLLKRTREAIPIVRSSDTHPCFPANDYPLVAIQALSHTITHLTQAGRFRQAADREKEVAQIFLQEQHDLRRACESFERAGDWYAQEDATAYVYPLASPLERLSLLACYSTANACFKDAADLHAELEEYPRAISLYDQVANSSLGSALTKYSVKDYWLKALLCALASLVSCHLRATCITCERSTRTT